jgi:hypothetical protein
MASRPPPGCTRRRCRRSATRCGCGCGSCPISTARWFQHTRRISLCWRRPSCPSRRTPVSPTPTRLCSPLPARRASHARRRARSRGLSPPRPRKLARFLDRARLRARSERDDPGAAGSAAAARAGRSDRRHDRQRRRLFAAAREGASRATLVEDNGISLVGPGYPCQPTA